MNGMSFNFDPSVLEPLIRRVVVETMTAIQADCAKLDGKLCFSEQEAARLLDIEPHVLRDERRRGCIVASQIVGRRIRYTRADLSQYLTGRRWTAKT